MPKNLSIAEETTKLGLPLQEGNFSFMILTTGKL
jgi:hypothetical protein